MKKCQAITNNNKQCSRNAIPNEIYCLQHFKQKTSIIPSIVKNHLYNTKQITKTILVKPIDNEIVSFTTLRTSLPKKEFIFKKRNGMDLYSQLQQEIVMKHFAESDHIGNPIIESSMEGCVY